MHRGDTGFEDDCKTHDRYVALRSVPGSPISDQLVLLINLFIN